MRWQTGWPKRGSTRPDGIPCNNRHGLPYIACMKYLRAHWLGEQPLLLSFWVNLVAVRALLWTLPLRVLAPDPLTVTAMITVIAADFALFVWQIVGVVRSAENRMLSRGGLAPTWGIFAALAVVVFAMTTQWLGLYQMTIEKPANELFAAKMDRLRESHYRLRVAQDGRSLSLEGTIELGMTKATAAILKREPRISRIELSSTGGNIFEARGMAALLLPLQLQTHVETECSSACTLVFMAGKQRTLGRNARLGFHAYRIDSYLVMPHIDVQAEQDRDRNYFFERRLTGSFLSRIYERDNADIWFPDRTELLAAGVIDAPDMPEQPNPGSCRRDGAGAKC
jgi:hypothetical protein